MINLQCKWDQSLKLQSEGKTTKNHKFKMKKINTQNFYFYTQLRNKFTHREAIWWLQSLLHCETWAFVKTVSQH